MNWLGIDGGGTRTDFMLLHSDGTARPVISKEPIDLFRVGFARWKEILQEGIHEVCLQSDLHVRDIDFTVIGVPGLGDEIVSEIDLLKKAVTRILQCDRFELVNDVEVGWAGSMACQAGIHLVSGTGAIGYGVDDAGRRARSSGWGNFCGDEGSAYWIGLRLLSAFTRQADGRAEKSILYESVKQHFQLQNDFQLLSILEHELQYQRKEIAGLAKLASEIANSGDVQAKKIFHDASEELALIVRSLINQLKFESEEIPVSYSGGVFQSGDLILKPLIKQLASERIRLVKPKLSPVTGAALYAAIKNRPELDPATFIPFLQKQESVSLGIRM